MAINKAPADRFTILHFLSGIAMKRLGFSSPSTLAVAIIWEMLESPLKENYPEAFPNPSQDSRPNKTVDVLAMMAGFYLG